jgi:hypothetical protein
MGDCYAMLGNPAMVKECYGRAASLLSASLVTNPRNGHAWANLAFYHAKVGDAASAESDIKNAEACIAKEDVASRFLISQALILQGKRKEALALLIWCIDHGLSEEEVNLALDLKDLRKDPTYLLHLKNRRINDKVASG